MCTIPQGGWPLLHQLWSTGWNKNNNSVALQSVIHRGSSTPRADTLPLSYIPFNENGRCWVHISLAATQSKFLKGQWVVEQPLHLLSLINNKWLTVINRQPDTPGLYPGQPTWILRKYNHDNLNNPFCPTLYQTVLGTFLSWLNKSA